MANLKVVKTTSPPDGGYGWVIVACSFLCYFLMSLLTCGFGLILVEWIQHFNVNKLTLTWIGAVHFSIGSLLLCECKVYKSFS